MKPIRVMHVIARMNVGGPAVEIAELMRGLDMSVIDQRLVTGHCGDDEEDFLETQAPDLAATRLDGFGRSLSPVDDALVLSRLVRIIRASRPDVVHTHTAKAGVLGRIAVRASGSHARVVHTYHGHLLHGYFGPARTRAVITAERRLAKVTDRLITVGEEVRHELLDAGIGRPEQYTVIRSGVRLGALPDRTAARRELGLPDGIIIALIGRLTRIKRPDRFADVVEIVRDRGVDAHFLVAGGGDQEASLRDRVARDRLPVSVLGWRSDIERILAAADIVVLTSDNEGVPLSLIQAASASLPVVATRVGSVPEVVQDGVTGVLCERSAPEIASALLDLVRDQQRREVMGRSAKAFVEREFTMHDFLAQHERTYARLARR